MLLSEVKGMGLQMIARGDSTRTNILLSFAVLHRSDLMMASELLSHVMSVTMRHWARLFHTVLIHE